MTRSLYKPYIPQDLRLIDLTKERQAYYRVDDKRDRTDVWRFGLKCGATVIRPEFMKFRIAIHGGDAYGKLIVFKEKMIGFRFGEFRRTKSFGVKNIHEDNRLSKKLQKKRQRLILEAQKRKTRKSKKTVLKEKKRAKDKAKAKAKVVRLRSAAATGPTSKAKK